MVLPLVEAMRMSLPASNPTPVKRQCKCQPKCIDHTFGESQTTLGQFPDCSVIAVARYGLQMLVDGSQAADNLSYQKGLSLCASGLSLAACMCTSSYDILISYINAAFISYIIANILAVLMPLRNAHMLAF